MIGPDPDHVEGTAETVFAVRRPRRVRLGQPGTQAGRPRCRSDEWRRIRRSAVPSSDRAWNGYRCEGCAASLLRWEPSRCSRAARRWLGRVAPVRSSWRIARRPRPGLRMKPTTRSTTPTRPTRLGGSGRRERSSARSACSAMAMVPYRPRPRRGRAPLSTAAVCASRSAPAVTPPVAVLRRRTAPPAGAPGPPAARGARTACRAAPDRKGAGTARTRMVSGAAGDREAGRMAGRVRRRTRRAVSGRSSGASGAAAMCLEPPHAPLRDRSRSPDRVRRDRRDGPPCRPAGACSPRGCDAMVRPRPRRAVNGPGPAASQRLPTRVHPTVQQRPRSPDTDHRRGMVAGQPGVPSRSVSSCGPRRRWSSGPTASTVRSSSTAPMKPGEVGSSIVPPSAA